MVSNVINRLLLLLLLLLLLMSMLAVATCNQIHGPPGLLLWDLRLGCALHQGTVSIAGVFGYNFRVLSPHVTPCLQQLKLARLLLPPSHFAEAIRSL